MVQDNSFSFFLTFPLNLHKTDNPEFYFNQMRLLKKTFKNIFPAAILLFHACGMSNEEDKDPKLQAAENTENSKIISQNNGNLLK
jgi:hypothetical protein